MPYTTPTQHLHIHKLTNKNSSNSFRLGYSSSYRTCVCILCLHLHLLKIHIALRSTYEREYHILVCTRERSRLLCVCNCDHCWNTLSIKTNIKYTCFEWLQPLAAQFRMGNIKLVACGVSGWYNNNNSTRNYVVASQLKCMCGKREMHFSLWAEAGVGSITTKKRPNASVNVHRRVQNANRSETCLHGHRL